MKNLTVALSAVAASVFLATSSNAAEIYNKDANKVDLYGKAVGLHYFSSDKDQNGDQTYARLGFRGETQIIILLVLVSGNIISRGTTLKGMELKLETRLAWHTLV